MAKGITLTSQHIYQATDAKHASGPAQARNRGQHGIYNVEVIPSKKAKDLLSRFTGLFKTDGAKKTHPVSLTYEDIVRGKNQWNETTLLTDSELQMAGNRVENWATASAAVKHPEKTLRLPKIAVQSNKVKQQNEKARQAFIAQTIDPSKYAPKDDDYFRSVSEAGDAPPEEPKKTWLDKVNIFKKHDKSDPDDIARFNDGTHEGRPGIARILTDEKSAFRR